MIWGVDLGTRSFALVGLYEEEELIDEPHLFKSYLLVKKQARGIELRSIAGEVSDVVLEDDVVFVEEPPMVRNHRTFGQLNQVAGAILSATSAQGYLVPVDSWKKATVGKGGVGKDAVADWLRATHPNLYQRCLGDQNLVDAACVALYGQQIIASIGGTGRVSAGDLDLSL